jgi:hypothetical protein
MATPHFSHWLSKTFMSGKAAGACRVSSSAYGQVYFRCTSGLEKQKHAACATATEIKLEWDNSFD